MRRASKVATLAVAASLTLPAASHAVIQVQRGISGIAIGMSQDQVRAGLGTPTVQRGHNEFGSFTTFRYTRLGITVVFQGNAGVTAVATTGFGDRTANGAGVGSTEATVMARVGGVHCSTIAGFRHCQVGLSRAGRRVTDFFIHDGRVSRVVVGVVID